MYQPAQLDSFLRLLIAHMGTVLLAGERLKEFRSTQAQMDMLLSAIEEGQRECNRHDELGFYSDSEALFVLQLSQSREWVDRLGQLDPGVERITDEFLANTFSIERMLNNQGVRKKDYRLENGMIEPGNDDILRHKLETHIDIDAMSKAIYELLGQLEEQYDMLEELEVKQVVNGVPFGLNPLRHQGAKVISFQGALNRHLKPENDNGS